MNLRTIFLAFTLIAFLTLPSAAAPRIVSLAATPSSSYLADAPSGLIIPLYTYPTSPTWNEVIQAKLANPGVQIIAIVNPYNGPGSTQDYNYANGINALKAAGVIVLGYVYTGYAKRSQASVEYDINAYHILYPALVGIFFDEMSSAVDSASYYQGLVTYMKSLAGFVVSVGNPGDMISPALYGIFNVEVIYENQGLFAISNLAVLSGFPRESFGAIGTAIPSFSPLWIVEASHYVGWLYLTSGSGSNPYDILPAYFAKEASSLNRSNAAIIFPLK